MNESDTREWLLAKIDAMMSAGNHIAPDDTPDDVEATEGHMDMFRELIAKWRLDRHTPERAR